MLELVSKYSKLLHTTDDLAKIAETVEVTGNVSFELINAV
jgi:hypothetical protein